MIQDIRDNVIVLINPVAEPDGRDKTVDWFYRHLKGKTDYDNLPGASPPYWGKYVFHDNNRDTHQKALKLTQAVHADVPRVPPAGRARPARVDPAAVNLDRHRPLQRRTSTRSRSAEWLAIAFHEVQTLTVARHAGRLDLGLRRVVGPALSRTRWPSTTTRIGPRLRDLRQRHRGDGRAHAATAERNRYVGKPVTDREWYRAVAARTRSSCGRCATTRTTWRPAASRSSTTASKNAQGHAAQLLPARATTPWQKGVKGNPYAFVIPEKQGDRAPCRADDRAPARPRDRGRAARARPVTVKEGELPEGRLRRELDQPYRNYALDLLRAAEVPGARRPTSPTTTWPGRCPCSYGLDAKRDRRREIRDARPTLTSGGDAGAVAGSAATGPVYPAEGHRAGGAARGARPAGALQGVDRGEVLHGRRRRLSRRARG